MSRTWPVPEAARTVHVIGDIHFNVRTWGGFQSVSGTPISGLWRTRWEKVVSDLASGAVPKPISRVCIGDLTDNGGIDPAPYAVAGNEDALAIAQIARLPALRTTAQPTQTPNVELIGGNHDVNYPTGSERGEAAFETAMGIPQANSLGHYTVDLGFVRILLLQQPRSAPGNTGKLDAADLAWLDAALTAAGTQECWIFYHYPLGDTVGGVQSGLSSDLNVYSSFAPDRAAGFAATDPSGSTGVDTNILATLASHANAKAWISGHTHSPLEAPGLVTSLTVGGHTMAVINVSAVYFTRRTVNPYDPIKTLYITKPSTGVSRIEVRFRNHGAGTWDAPAGLSPSRVATVTL